MQGPILGLQLFLDSSAASTFKKKENLDIEFRMETVDQPYQIKRLVYHENNFSALCERLTLFFCLTLSHLGVLKQSVCLHLWQSFEILKTVELPRQKYMSQANTKKL